MRKPWITAIAIVLTAGGVLGLSTCENPATSAWDASYTVTLDFNYEDAGDPVVEKVKKGDPILLPDITREDNTGLFIAGWWTSPLPVDSGWGDRVAEAGDTYTPEASVTLYAHWGSGKITFDLNYTGAPAPWSVYLADGDYLTLPSDADRTGYSLKEWNTKADGSGTSIPPGGTYRVTGTTFYAQWTEGSGSGSGGATTFTITFEKEGGTGGTSTTTVTLGSAVKSITPPTKGGYQFEGYYTAQGGSGYKYYDYSGKSTLTTWTENPGPSVFYAHWEPAVYTITFNPSPGAGGQTTATVTYLSAVPNLTDGIPTRTDGVSFLGYWANGTQYYDAAGNGVGTWNIASSATLYASWEGDEADTGLTFSSYVSYYNGVYTIQDGANVTVSGSTTSDRIKVASGATATLTLNNVTIDMSAASQSPAISAMDANTNLTLVLTGSSTLKGSYALPGVCTNNGGSVTIKGSGSLTAVGGYAAAGIGGSWSQDNGTVIIESGTVNAQGGGDFAAGIGGGNLGSGGTIRITGGTVNATAGICAAGIGGGEDSASGGDITITGGHGTARSPHGYGRAVGPCYTSGGGGSFNGVAGNWPADTTVNGFRTYTW